MGERFNIYCDESCHLEHDRASVMVLGAVWCPVDRVQEISIRLRELKQKHRVLSIDDLRQPRLQQFEVKWTKVSKAKLALYLDWIDHFFDDDDLHFRGVLIDKTVLDHAARQQSYDDWYYKMLFRLLEPIIDPQQQYRIYLDIKDTRSEQKRAKLEEVLRCASHDRDSTIIAHVQQVRSHESEVLQVADLLIGAIAYHENAQDRRVVSWTHRKGREQRRYLWLDESYLVVLGERGHRYQLITAFCTDREPKKKLRREYEESRNV